MLSESRYFDNLNGSQSQLGKFANPFHSLYPRAILTSFPNALAFCRYVWNMESTYKTAITRVIGHFITELEIGGKDSRREEKKQMQILLERKLGINKILYNVLCNYRAYGNDVITLTVPFTRHVRCMNNCGTELPYREAFDRYGIKLDVSHFIFHGYCPACQCGVKYRPIDRKVSDPTKVKVKSWPLEEIEIIWDPASDATEYVWKIPEYYSQRLLGNDPIVVEHATEEVVNAVQRKQFLQFDNDEVFHMKDQTLSGVHSRGWGISSILTSFDDLVELRMLRRANAAIVEDYIVPLRLLTPELRSTAEQTAGDPARNLHLGADFVHYLNRVIRQKRRDLTSMFVVPYPVRYQLVGGDAKQLVPHELLSYTCDQLLNGAGVPTDFYRGTMTTESSPSTMRLLESQWAPLIRNRDAFLTWLAGKLCALQSWAPMQIRMLPPRQADDPATKLAELQLMTGQQISRTSGLKAVNKDFEQETILSLEEQEFAAEKQIEYQKKTDAAAQGAALMAGATPSVMQAMQGGQGGQPQPGGAPPGGGGGGGNPADRSLDQVEADAKQTAANMMSMSETQRRSELGQLAKRDKLMHAVVLQELKAMRSSAATAGKAQILAQQFPQH